MGKELVISGKIIKGQLVKIEVKTTDKQQIGESKMVKTKDQEPKKPVLSAIGVAFRLIGPDKPKEIQVRPGVKKWVR